MKYLSYTGLTYFYAKIKALLAGKMNSGDAVNNLLSTSTTLPLAASQGPVIQSKFDEVNNQIAQQNNNFGRTYLLSGGEKIANDANLNNYVTPGNYYCVGNSDAQTISNSPCTVAFTMKIEHASGNSDRYILQTIREYNSGRDHVRFCSDGNWTSWKSVVLNTDLDALANDFNMRSFGFQVQKAGLAPAGWYRVAQFHASSNFQTAHSWFIDINTSYNNANNMSATMLVNAAYVKYKITQLGSSINVKVVDKVRIVRNSEGAGIMFVEIYYTANVANNVIVNFNSISGWNRSYFVPVNLTPVTDSDLTTVTEFTIT